MSLSGTKYSIGQIQTMLRQAGWPDIVVIEADGDTVPLIVLMSAIAMSESSGYAGAHNTSGEDSVGLLQINRNAHPELTVAQLSDPITNLTKAYQVYLREGLNAWGPYQTGIYAANIDAAYAAYGGGTIVSPTTSVSDILNGSVAPDNTNDTSGDTQNIVYIALASFAALILISRLRQ